MSSAAIQGSAPPEDDEVLALLQDAFQNARTGDASGLGRLLDRGVPPNVRNEKGDSLLMIASYNGHAESTRLLLERGADPEIRNDRGQSPLAGAAFRGDLVVAALLLSQGARIDGCGPDGKTPLMFAAMFDRVEMIDLLLTHGASPDHRDASGTTAFTLAKAMGAEHASARLEAMKDRFPRSDAKLIERGQAGSHAVCRA